MNESNDIINYINDYIDILLEEKISKRKTKKVQSDIDFIRGKIEKIKSSFLGKTDKDFPYKECRIEFYSEYKLPIPKYGLDEVYRTLKDTMYFTIIGGDLENGILDLKTKSLKNTYFNIRLENIKTFSTNKNNKSDAFLVYKNIYAGDKEKIIFKFKSLK